MGDPTAKFFDRLGREGHETLPKNVSATILVDLLHDGETDHWFLDMSEGQIRVSREVRPADCVIRAEAALFDRLVTGEVSMFSAVLRNQVTVGGDERINVILQKMLPGPPGAHDSRVRGR